MGAVAVEVGYLVVSIMYLKRYKNAGTTSVEVRSPMDGLHPPKDTIIYPVWEISLTGPHDTPWARLNAIGHTSDWHLANSLALSVEWEENGERKSSYQQADEPNQFDTSTTTPGAMATYNIAMAMMRFLDQRRMPSVPVWFFDPGVARIKTLTFDNLT